MKCMVLSGRATSPRAPSGKVIVATVLWSARRSDPTFKIWVLVKLRCDEVQGASRMGVGATIRS